MRGIHHIEIWVPELAQSRTEWGWLLERLGFVLDGQWNDGVTFRCGDAYITLAISPHLTADHHDRRRAGVNHLAFHGGDEGEVDDVINDASQHGWAPLYQDRYPHAGGPNHYAGWLQNTAGFKVEIVARPSG